MNPSFMAQPRITLLSPLQIEQVHRYALEILSTIGIRIESPAFLALLTQAAGIRLSDTGQVLIAPEIVEWAINAAPASFTIYNRRGEPAFCPGDDRTRFGVGVTNLYYQDPITNAVAPFSRQNMVEGTRLANALPHFDMVSTIGVIRDESPARADLIATLEMVANTTKPLILLVSDDELFPAVLDLVEHLCGDLATHPFVIPYFNPITPLVLNTGTAIKMKTAIERGLPIIYSNYGMAGASTPITPGGTLALLNAELLAGLVFSQIIKEGAPIILGMLPSFFDMKSMTSFYDPKTILLNLACAEMMAHYQVPHCGTSGSETGWGADVLQAGTLWMNHLTGLMGKVGMAPFVGSTLGSMAFSPVATVLAHEIIGQSLDFSRGIDLDTSLVGLDELRDVGPGGNFLMADLTLKHFRNAYYQSDIFPRMSLESWQAKGRPQAEKILADYTMDLLANLKPPDDQPDILARGEAFISPK